MRIEEWTLDKISPYPDNPRDNEAAVRGVADSIQAFGWQQPIVVDTDGVIIAGHTRYKAAKLLGLKTAPVVVASDLTPDEVQAYRLVDNKSGEKATWDMDKLKIELKGIELDMSPWFAQQDLSFATHDGADELPDEETVECRAKRGEVWQLGRHRVMCGDSTSADDVETLMNGNRADLLLTDPPYGIKRDEGFGGFGGFEGFGQPIARKHYKGGWDNATPSKEGFDIMAANAEKQIIFGGNFFTDKLPVNGFWLVWDKHNTMPTFGDCELAWTNIKRKSVKKYDVVYNGLIGKEKTRDHATQKPVKLFADIMEDFTSDGQTVLDLYGGSGTTLIAAEQLGRTCYMMELDPHYVDVIIERWEQLTGGKAEKVKRNA